MTTLELATGIQLDEAQAQLIDRILKGEWNEIDPKVLRRLVPNRLALLKFLEANGLMDEPETQIALERMGIDRRPSVERAKLAAARKRILLKKHARLRAITKARKNARKKIAEQLKNRKGKKSPVLDDTDRFTKA
jgi:hypothetical protein